MVPNQLVFFRCKNLWIVICIKFWYMIYFCRKCLFIYVQMYNCFVFSTSVTRGKNLQHVIFQSIPATSFGRIPVLIFYYIWYNTSINILVSIGDVVAVLHIYIFQLEKYFDLKCFYIYFQFCCFYWLEFSSPTPYILQ